MDSFWHICTEALLMDPRKNPEGLAQLLKRAEDMLHQGEGIEPGNEAFDIRAGFLGRLKAQIQAPSRTGTSKSPEESRPSGARAPEASLPQPPGTGPTPGKRQFGNQDYYRQKNRADRLERQNAALSTLLQKRPTIDPLCLADPTFTIPQQEKEDFGIILFGFTRVKEIGLILESLKRQDALQYTEVWLDGHQGNHNLKKKLEISAQEVRKYPVKHLHTQSGNYGFRKMILLGLADMCKRYRDILILEDDCFPTRNAVLEFRRELDNIRNDPGIFSVYGHHFRVEQETETCSRFQGWGWATTSEKLLPVLRQLIDCYSMPEKDFLEFVRRTLTPDVKARIDVTEPRQPSYVLENFFAWDETLCLLTALNGQVHKKTREQTIYNCGLGEGSTHFQGDHFRKPPFNLITPDEVWDYF